MTMTHADTLDRQAPDAIAGSRLIETIDYWSRGRHDVTTALPGLGLFRRETPMPPADCMIEPSIVVVVQGAKRMWIGDDAYDYDASRFLLTSLDLPARSEVIEASPQAPCLGLALRLDTFLLAELMAQGGARPAHGPVSGVGLGAVTSPLQTSLQRLVALLDEPEAIPFLAPLMQREIHYRLLQSDQAGRLRQIASADAHGYRIGRVVEWLKSHYARPLRVEELAAQASMSVPSFHHHFRKLTTMTPLQYQKRLRLDEARRLMLNQRLDVASAAFRVGYESPSQFSREYRRMFGAPPKRDIMALRHDAEHDRAAPMP